MNNAVSFVVSYAVNASWQIPLLAGAGWGAARMLRHWGPQPQHATWVVTLLAGIVTPGLALRVALPLISGKSIGTAGVSVTAAGAGTAMHAGTLLMPAWLMWLVFGVYLCAVAFFAVRLARLYAGARALVRESAPMRRHAEQEALWQRVRRAFAMTDATVLSSEQVRGIVTIGARKPAILIPAALRDEWTEEDSLSALGHELAHVLRRDYTKNLIYETVSLLTAFHPVCWMVKAQIVRTREMICDGMVVERLVDRKSYRQSLLRLAQRMMVGRPAAMQGVGMFDANVLEERITMMKSKKQVPSRLVRGGLSGCAALLLVAGIGASVAFAKPVATPAADHDQGPDKVYHPGPDVTNPVLTYAPDPEFPKSAMKEPRGFSVVCTVGTVVNRDGKPEDVHVVRSAGADFDAEAMKAVRRYRFTPGMHHSKPVAVAINIEVNFRKY